MPVTVHAEIRQLGQDEFRELAYEVMGQVFKIHGEFGRFLREEIYHREIARRTGGLNKIPIEVTFGQFRKFFFIDLLVAKGAMFELKTVQGLTDRHRSQLLQYLLLAELSHGKLINLRPDLVEHEFVNTTLTRADRTRFTIDQNDWDGSEPGAAGLRNAIVELLRDLGASLSSSLYEGAITHFLGGKDAVLRNVEIQDDGRVIGLQRVRVSAPSLAFKITTAHENEQQRIENHLRRFLGHTTLSSIQWINVRHQVVTFKTIRRGT